MKYFERLVMTHRKRSIDTTAEPHQYSYRQNFCTDDAISAMSHQFLTHLENKDFYVRLVFLDFSSAFNTAILQTLVKKLS